jgi:predicted ATP-grasp superfamily ATP-dependent carboligase
VYPDSLAALGVCRGLGPHGIAVSVVSTDRTSPAQYSRYARRVACPRGADAESVVGVLVDVARGAADRPVLYLTDDASLMAIEPHRSRLEAWYRFPHAPWPVLETVLLKDRLYRALEGVVPVPKTREPERVEELGDVARELGWPIILKPRLRCLSDAPAGGQFEKVFGGKAIRARSMAELEAAFRAAREHGFPMLVQEEVPGPVSSLYSVGLYATRRGEVPAAFTSQKLGQVPPDFGDGLVVKAVWAPQVVPLAAAAVRALGYYGMADIEFKLDARTGEYKLLDINPRPWLWMNLPAACGVNLAHAAYLDALDRPVDPRAFEQRDFTTRWVSVRGLLVHVARSLARGRVPHGLVDALRRFRGRRVGPFLTRDDLLVRMFVSPGYWWEFARSLTLGLRHSWALGQGR